jgi:hypothetical protein
LRSTCELRAPENRWTSLARLCKSGATRGGDDMTRKASLSIFAISLLAAIPASGEIGHFVPVC